MRQALVIHPQFTVYGGGEMVCLHVIKALQQMDYHVTVASDHFESREVEQKFGLGSILARCDHLPLPRFKPSFPRLLGYQRLSYYGKTMRKLESLRPDIAFSTQALILYLRNTRNLSIVYDLAEFFSLHASGQLKTNTFTSVALMPYQAIMERQFSAFSNSKVASRTFVPLSSLLEYELELFGYPHTQVVFPPCDLIFKPREKKQRVVQVSRAFPSKRLEEFIEVARRLGDYDFIIVGTDSATESQTDPRYVGRLLANKPDNLEYIETRIRNRPDLLEESKVYLYNSIEPGINISAVQALGAGCLPVTPIWGGGAEIVQYSGVGFAYKNIDDATEKVRRALVEPVSPYALAEKAKIFSAEAFEETIIKIVAQ
jgi:glycosyltransferase involved in cell wall biosynthesis